MVIFKPSVNVYIFLIIFFVVMQTTVAKPMFSGQASNNLNFCKSNDKILEACQRCAKQTKSPIVYPMCCADLENVYDWCDKYIHYGYFASKEDQTPV